MGKQRRGRGRSVMGGDGSSLCCWILSFLPGLAALHRPPQFCAHLIVGTELKRPIGTALVLPMVRQQTLIYLEGTASSVPVSLGSPFCTPGAVGAGKLRIGLPHVDNILAW